MHVSIGMDTYGRVKSVRGTAIVTRFFALQHFPLYPLESYYVQGAVQQEEHGIPFIASVPSAPTNGVPLARVNRTSVAMAYVRGICAALFVFGCLVIFPLVAMFSGEHLDFFATAMLRSMLVCLVVGLVAGLLTYAVPLLSRRERQVREYCGELLGMCIDPAQIPTEHRDPLIEFAYEAATAERGGIIDARTETLLQLMATRCGAAQASGKVEVEARTTELLGRLKQLDRMKI